MRCKSSNLTTTLLSKNKASAHTQFLKKKTIQTIRPKAKMKMKKNRWMTRTWTSTDSLKSRTMLKTKITKTSKTRSLSKTNTSMLTKWKKKDSSPEKSSHSIPTHIKSNCSTPLSIILHLSSHPLNRIDLPNYSRMTTFMLMNKSTKLLPITLFTKRQSK